MTTKNINKKINIRLYIRSTFQTMQSVKIIETNNPENNKTRKKIPYNIFSLFNSDNTLKLAKESNPTAANFDPPNRTITAQIIQQNNTNLFLKNTKYIYER